MSSRAKFWDVFKELPSGQLEPTRRVEINGVSFGPGVRFGSGVSYGGIDLHHYKGLDLDVIEREDGVLVIVGIYPE